MATKDAHTTKTVDRAIDILECFLRAPDISRGMTLMELSSKTKLSASTAYRIISTLESRGCLRRDGLRGETYRAHRQYSDTASYRSPKTQHGAPCFRVHRACQTCRMFEIRRESAHPLAVERATEHLPHISPCHDRTAPSVSGVRCVICRLCSHGFYVLQKS